MKKSINVWVILFALLLGWITTSSAQTTLGAGDVAIMEFNGNGDDGFSFMPLVDLAAGTVIHFTDYGWNGTSLSFHPYEEGNPPTGGGNMITYTAPSAVVAGTLIRQDKVNVGGSAFTADADWPYNYYNYTYIGALNSLTTGHDGILVFQGTPSAPTFIWGYYTGHWGKGSYVDYYWSDLPTDLTNGTNAVFFVDSSSWSSDVTVDDGYYRGPTTAASAADWRTRVADASNWTTSASGTAPTLLYPKTYTVTSTSVAPTVTTQAVSGISSTTATGNGNITSLGSPNPTAYGVCWNTTGTPTASGTKVDNGSASATGAFTASMTGLTANTTYYLRAYAINTVDTSYGSEVSFTTSKIPQTITFANPGAQNFGTTPTLSASSTSGLDVSFTSSTTNVCTITSAGALTFLATGTCTINADQAGNGTYTAATTVSRSFSVNAVASGAPTIGIATAGDAQATISFTAPASNGGATITSYMVTSNPGDLTASGPASPLTVTGLTNGTSYTFTVTATNSAGTSVASAASNAVTPKGAQMITFAAFTDMTYGDADFAPDAETSSGFSLSFTSDNENVAKITDAGLVQIIGAGNATITASQAGNSAYEAATAVSHDLTVVKAPLTISVQNDTISEGNSDPIYQFTFDGFVNGEGASDLTDLTATRDPGTIPGNYTITPSASSTNYDIDFVNGTLTIETTTSILVLGAQNISVRPVQGGLSLTGLRGNLEIFSLRGEHVQSLRVNRDGVYAVNLKAGSYVLRLGSRTWTLSSNLDR
jgi:hypothetical protein